MVRSVGRVTSLSLPDEIEDMESYDPVTEATKAELAGRGGWGDDCAWNGRRGDSGRSAEQRRLGRSGTGLVDRRAPGATHQR